MASKMDPEQHFSEPNAQIFVGRRSLDLGGRGPGDPGHSSYLS
jgi:hypothetical protein